jgi:4-amino-4-deoxy-L-arabinose transferase-like glycosyltransferase
MRSIMQKKYILFLIPFILYICLLSVMPQMEPDEARYSLIASAMNQSGNYVTPHIKNTIYLEKPPLVSWATAILFKILGENDFAARLFAALCAWGCILLVYFIGRRFCDEKTGLYAAMLLTTSLLPFILGHLNILDIPLTFFVCLSAWFGYLALQKQSPQYFLYLFYFSCALAFLTKGLIGVLFPSGILIVWLIWVGRWREIWKFFSPVGILIFLAVVCPWLILAQKENSDFLWFFFVREHFLRFTTKMHGKTEPFYFYLPVIIGGVIPWIFYLIKAWKNKYITESLFTRDENKFLITWFLLIFAFYTVSSSKLIPYITPVFLPLSLFAGSIFKRYEEEMPAEQKKWRNIIYRLAIILQSLILFIALILPPILKKYAILKNDIIFAILTLKKEVIIVISDKWWLYIAVPLIVLFLMTFLPDLIYKKFKKGWFFSIYILCAVLLGSLLFPINDFLGPYRSAKVAGEAIARYVPQDRDLYQYRVNFYGIDFYNKIRTPIVEDFGELAEGIAKMPGEEKKHYFLSVDEFFKLCEDKKDIYCITRRKEKLLEITKKFSATEVLWDNKAFYLLHIKN